MTATRTRITDATPADIRQGDVVVWGATRRTAEAVCPQADGSVTILRTNHLGTLSFGGNYRAGLRITILR